MPPNVRRAVGVSVGLHAVGVALALALLPRALPRTPSEPASVELDFTAAPARPAAPPPPPPAIAAPTPPPAPTATPTPRPASALARTVVRPNPVAPTTVEPSPEASSGGTLEPSPPTAAPPSPNPAPTGGTAGHPLTAAELYGNVDGLASAAAAAGSLDLGRPGSGYRAQRDLFGREQGSTMDRARAAAAAPTLQALADSQHMQAAGTMRHDRTAARRAEEAFMPAREVPNLGAALTRTPLHMMPPPEHVASAGESAIGASLDAAHGQSFAMGNVFTPAMTACPPFHVVRADVEVDQDVSGAVLATRVVSSSRIAGFDEAAMRAIREALPEAPALNAGAGRRSRWSFEVSDTACPEGWRAVGDESNGVRMRMRVRMIGARELTRGS